MNTYATDHSFGFEDGVSQPLMGGMDNLEQHGPPNMNTDPNIIIVTPTTHHEGETSRPVWMYDGSFVVFRKLEQNVQGFEALTDQWQKYQCLSKGHLGAKLMGRWQSGKRLSSASVPSPLEILILLPADDSHGRCFHCQFSS